jgi:predicted nucleic acid-binding protein
LNPSEVIGEQDDVALPALSLVEFRVGTALADSQHQLKMERFYREVLIHFTVLPYNDAVMEHHIRLLAWTHRRGTARSAVDLMIAATAAATGRILVTTDAKAQFQELPGVHSQVIQL